MLQIFYNCINNLKICINLKYLVNSLLANINTFLIHNQQYKHIMLLRNRYVMKDTLFHNICVKENVCHKT